MYSHLHHVEEKTWMQIVPYWRFHCNIPISQILWCIRQVSHNEPFCNKYTCVYIFLAQNDALWIIWPMNCGICEMGLLSLIIKRYMAWYCIQHNNDKGGTYVRSWTTKGNQYSTCQESCTQFAPQSVLLWSGIHWLHPYATALFHWHMGNPVVALVAMKWPWRV